MRKKSFPRIITLFFIAMLLFVPNLQAAEKQPIENIKSYFQDRIGMIWTYQGTLEEGIQKISTYTNMASVKGTTKIEGILVKVFVESNQANQGPAESYFLKKDTGIFYYGGNPTTSFEQHLLPYLVIPFPMVLEKLYTQLDKKTVPFGRDLDQDGIEELADVSATVIAKGFETISVPAGVFKDSLKLTGRMVIRITLSANKKVIELVDLTSNWFAPGVGMVSRTESVNLPAVGVLPPTATIIKEQLSEYSKNPLSIQ